MRRYILLVLAATLAGVPHAGAQSAVDAPSYRPTGRTTQAEDTLPERVVERALDAFRRHDVAAWVGAWDSVSYFQDLEPGPVPANHPGAPAMIRAEQRARVLKGLAANTDPRGPGHMDVIQRLVAGRFVVCHIAVWWDSPYGDTHNFQKIEIFEVRHGKIVAEYDGQYVAAGRPGSVRDP